APLALEPPATHYGLLAGERLAERDAVRAAKVAARLAEQPTAQLPDSYAAGSLLDDPHFRAGVELLRLGFDDAASSELLAARRGGQPPDAQRLLVQALAGTGDLRPAHGVARLSLRGDLGGPLTASNRAFWDIAYPDAFRELVLRYTRGSGVEPELLQALMREESALDPHALSWAGAVGLTQLMLPTAREVARGLRLKAPTVERLQEPATSIQLGSAYLAGLPPRLGGQRAPPRGRLKRGTGRGAPWAPRPPQPRPRCLGGGDSALRDPGLRQARGAQLEHLPPPRGATAGRRGAHLSPRCS